MAADVPQRARRASFCRIRLPGAASWRLARRPRSQPALHIVHADGLNLSELPARDQLASLPHHGVARVVVSHREDRVTLDEPNQCLGLAEIDRHRLVADHVESGLQGRAGDFKVRGVRRGDAHEINAPVRREFGFCARHFGKGAVRPVRRHREFHCRGPRFVRVRGEGSGRQFRSLVQRRGRGVHAADEPAAGAAHEPHSQPAPQRAVDRLHVQIPHRS